MSRRLGGAAIALVLASGSGSVAVAAPPPISVDVGDGASITLEPLPGRPPTQVHVPLPPQVPRLVAPVTEKLRPRTGSPVRSTPPSIAPTAPPRAEGAPSAPASVRAPARSRTPGGPRLRTPRALAGPRQSADRTLRRQAPETAAQAHPATGESAPAPRTQPRPRAGVLATVVGVLPGWVRWVLGILGSLAVLFGASWLTNRIRAARLRRHSRALAQDAGMMKQTLLTEPQQRVGPLLCSVASEHADSPDAEQGFHDVFVLGRNRTGILIGQVSEGGAAALAQAALMRHRLRAHLELGLPPRSVLRRADDLRRDDRHGGATAATVAIYDGARGSLTYSCVGHPTPYVFASAASVGAPVANFAPPMGSGVDCDRRQTTISLPPGATACLFSDGLRWRPDGQDALDRDVLSAIADLEEPSADAVLSHLRDRTRSGDLIVCLLRAAVAGIAPRSHVEELVLEPDETAAAHSFLIACGLAPRQAAEVAATAAEQAGRTGHSLLRVSWGEDGPETEIVTYRRESEWPARPVAGASHA